MIRMYRYSGAGNSFIVIDGRNVDVSRFRKRDTVHSLCLFNGTDGLMILDSSEKADFSMEYYNSDGSSGMMCGNGGRCIVAFADLLGVKPFHTQDYVFEAPDGIHRAMILSHLGECKVVRLEMRDVIGVKAVGDGWFLNTGTRHFVRFTDDVETVDVETIGRSIRQAPAFAPEGTNANFVSVCPDGSLKVRTYEKGVEAETLACGTGITASAIAAYIKGVQPFSCGQDGSVLYRIHARQDDLEVSFRPSGAGRFTEIFLTGPTLCEGEME